jgi:hypothetical protein
MRGPGAGAFFAGILALGVSLSACGARTPLLVDQGDSITGDGGVPPRHLAPADKIDLLFMIDNSASMADKQALLKDAVPDLLTRLVNPRCVDPNDRSKILGTSSAGDCTEGVLEFPAVHDLHVGIVTSSLGGRGSDACPPRPNPVDPSLDAHDDDHGHLIMRGGQDEHPIKEGAPSNFLAWFPPGGENQKGTRPAVTPIQDPHLFESDFEDLVAGVHEFGCGYEAQLESWYRFLIQPDPYDDLVNDGQTVHLSGTDEVILQQRHDFLRPDSLVAIMLLTDENDSTIDPLALGGRAWAYENTVFPGSPTQGAPRPTSACASNPSSTACRACNPGDSDPSCATNGGFYAPDEYPVNVRFFNMKQRLGVDPRFPLNRYVDALTSAKVPNRDGEHPNGAPDYLGQKNCTNPLFAKNLPVAAKDELCNLARGPRALDLVYFGVIGGVPHELLHFDPTSADRSRLTDGDWLKILGRDPERYDFSGIDPHMLESTTPRAGLPGPGASNSADPINGRDWDTSGDDLEYACVFDLAAPRDCASAVTQNGCDCATRPSPVCDENRPKVQVRAKAYPTVRELLVARALGERGIVGSLCPIHTTPQTPDDPLYGYRPAMQALIDRLRVGLQ